MSRIEWDTTGERYYESGSRQCVLYPQVGGAYPKGVPWNGFTGASEKPSGAEATPLYANDSKYLNLLSTEEFAATISAYTYPDEFAECDGSVEIAKGVYIGQQPRKPFGLSYRTSIGNDTDGIDHGYKLHLVYGCTAAPSEKQYDTMNNDPNAITFSWELSTIPVKVTGHRPTANVTIDSRDCDPAKLAQLEDILYGSESEEARLPLPDEVATIVGQAVVE